MHGMLLKHKYADNVKAIVFFFSVREYILSFGFSVGFEGKIKMLKLYYVAMECADVVAFTRDRQDRVYFAS